MPTRWPQKKLSSATKLKTGVVGQPAEREEFDGIIDINMMKAIEEEQRRAMALAAGRSLDHEIAMAKREAKAEKKKLMRLDADSKKILVSEEAEQVG